MTTIQEHFKQWYDANDDLTLRAAFSAGWKAAQEQPLSLLIEKDAARYLWLRVHGNKFFNAIHYQGTGLIFDASVDSAIAEQEGRPS